MLFSDIENLCIKTTKLTLLIEPTVKEQYYFLYNLLNSLHCQYFTKHYFKIQLQNSKDLEVSQGLILNFYHQLIANQGVFMNEICLSELSFTGGFYEFK